MKKKEAFPRNFRDIPIVSKGGFGPEVERMIRDEIMAREDELRQQYQDYINDTGDMATSFAEFARMIIATEEGLLKKENTMRKKGNVIEVKEEVHINEDVVLEVGDKIEVLSEDIMDDMDRRIQDAWSELFDALTDMNDHTGAELIEAILDRDTRKAEKVFQRWIKREKQGFLTPRDY